MSLITISQFLPKGHDPYAKSTDQGNAKIGGSNLVFTANHSMKHLTKRRFHTDAVSNILLSYSPIYSYVILVL